MVYLPHKRWHMVPLYMMSTFSAFNNKIYWYWYQYWLTLILGFCSSLLTIWWFVSTQLCVRDQCIFNKNFTDKRQEFISQEYYLHTYFITLMLSVWRYSLHIRQYCHLVVNAPHQNNLQQSCTAQTTAFFTGSHVSSTVINA